MAYVNENNDYLTGLVSDMRIIEAYINEGNSLSENACRSLTVSGGLGERLLEGMTPQTRKEIWSSGSLERLTTIVTNYMSEIERVDKGTKSAIDDIANQQPHAVHWHSIYSIIVANQEYSWRKILLMCGILHIGIIAKIDNIISIYQQIFKVNDGQTTSEGTHDGNTESTNEDQPVVVKDPQISEEERKQQIFSEMEERFARIKKHDLEINPNDKNPCYRKRCASFVYQQLKDMGLVGGNDSTNYGKDYASFLANKGTTGTGAKCYGYSSLDELLDAKNQPISNVVCSFTTGNKAGHAMLITRIENGKVYYMDTLSSTVNEKDGLMINQCKTIDEWKKEYSSWANLCKVTHIVKE